MNIPYVKEYDEKGLLLNPIKDSYLNKFQNRRERHKILGRFFGNGKNFHLTVTPISRFKRVRQMEFDKNGNRKIIEHYLNCN